MKKELRQQINFLCAVNFAYTFGKCKHYQLTKARKMYKNEVIEKLKVIKPYLFID